MEKKGKTASCTHLALFPIHAAEAIEHYYLLLGFTPRCNSLPDAIVGLGLPPKYLHLTKIYYNLIVM